MFCKQCGTQLPDGTGFCTACGAPQGVQSAPVNPAPVNPAPTPMANVAPNIPVNTQPTALAIYAKKVLSQVLGFLKAPSKTLVGAYSEKTPVWATLVGALVLFGWWAIMALVQAAPLWNEYKLSEFNIMADTDANFGMILLYSLIILVGGFGIKTCITWLTATQVAKLNVPFTSVLSVLALTELPLIAALFLASFTCFIWYPLALAILIIGGIATATLYNEAIRATGIFGEKAPCLTVIVNCIYGLILTLLIYWAVYAISEECYYISLVLSKLFEY